jgi:hypothetical protein
MGQMLRGLKKRMGEKLERLNEKKVKKVQFNVK